LWPGGHGKDEYCQRQEDLYWFHESTHRQFV